MKKIYSFLKLSNFKFKSQIFWTNFRYFFYNLQRKNLKIFKFFDQRKIGSIPRVFLSCVIIVSFFYAAPIIINYGNQNFFISNEYQNNSKAILAYTLNNKTNNLKSNDELLDEKDLLFDIFSLNDLEKDTVRLNASTIKQLYLMTLIIN